MKKINKDRFNSLINSIEGIKIAVIGDLMLDHYLWGSVARISPEAPVPVVDIENESYRLGGAANVGNNILSLGGIPVLIGVIGNDNSGKILLDIMKEKNLDQEGIIVDETRPTTIKTRVIAHGQHIVRTDRELKDDIDENTCEKVVEIFKKKIGEVDGIILQDYNKGVLSKNLITEIIYETKKWQRIIVVDPKFNNFFEFKDVYVIKPNKREAESVLGFKIDSPERLKIAGNLIRQRLNCKNVLITRGEKGMSLFTENGEFINVSTRAREVHDVSGAGDTVISTLTSIILAGGDVIEAATIANYAAGVVCGEVGIVPVEKEKLINAFSVNFD
ncbi:D-glycero-beta-D-manno-heptose-7-phosphate kinase [candidate division KSB1 bacterium]|nr:MAG: D-glycero-beta-D-manno-heptose-7-phosphate kinase [candidate division KSB1 bacterium]